MQYNFDEVIDRRGTNSVKWDLCEPDVLPMWVADMDFKTASVITESLQKTISTGIYGYSLIPDAFYESVISWWVKQHNFTIQKEWLLATTGVLPSLSAIIRTFVKPGENVILQTPVYNHFFSTLENCGCNILQNDLLYDDGIYSIDFEDLENKIADPQTKLLLLSNPHNPIGRAYERAELEKICQICSKHNVMVVSDEIHSDLVFQPKKHTPFIEVSSQYDIDAISCGSPCKTFNMSALPISYLVSQNKELLDKVQQTLDMQDTLYPNIVAVNALIAAYSHGAIWVKDLKSYVVENYKYLIDFCSENLLHVKVIPLDATYLVWLDFGFLNQNAAQLSQILLEEEKLWLNAGIMYGTSGEGFLRMNIACPRVLLLEGLDRLKRFYDRITV
ncbi:MalY/PatB family protein [Paenimyroides baculatum]|uniref:cysteine-S-conjugate beta-lyase n=1 Tax=Paenimyroides baculatum TaxID=2608000 RepID=A0A5M6CQV2_9FLAO|nr:MalY/PatB family protein [Paenimyroides baculatum]KAA5535549.1 pyridoxal phosphate-dependent aminotransferase [Paenimyroides baculatum]